MITVTVRIYATLQRFHPDLRVGEPLLIELEDNATCGSLFDKLNIPKDEVNMVFVNGKWEAKEHALNNGDRVGIFPLIGGG